MVVNKMGAFRVVIFFADTLCPWRLIDPWLCHESWHIIARSSIEAKGKATASFMVKYGFKPGWIEVEPIIFADDFTTLESVCRARVEKREWRVVRFV